MAEGQSGALTRSLGGNTGQPEQSAQSAGTGMVAGGQAGMATGGALVGAASGITGWGVGVTWGMFIGLVAGIFLGLAISRAGRP